MEVERLHTHLTLNALETLNTSAIISTILDEWSAVTDYRTLRDSLPRRLAHLLRCRCVLFYQYSSETLQFASGSFDDIPGWSAGLLAIAHINPIDINSNILEARAWQTRHATLSAAENTSPELAELVAVPLIYRQRAIGVLVAYRKAEDASHVSSYPTTGTLSVKPSLNEKAPYWSAADLPIIEAVAGVVTMLLENTRFLERDRRRIHELSLLNSIAGQLSSAGYDPERIYAIVTQRTREITSVDLCALITPTTPLESIPWITPSLREMLFDRLGRLSKQQETQHAPLIIERPGEAFPAASIEYWRHLPTNIKTFFAIPLMINENTIHTTALNSIRSSLHHGSHEASHAQGQGVKVPCVIVGAYYKPWKLRREELVLLQILANQASASLENIHLLAEVVDARNQARKLLRRVLDDVATMSQMEEEKRRLDRLASLGEMAASVAHEVRNPLASIKTSMQMLKDDLEDAAGTTRHGDSESDASDVNEDAQESVSIVLKEVERLDAIVRDLLLFAKPRQLHCVVCNLRELSDHVLQVMQPRCLELGVTIQRKYTDVPLAYVDIAQMEQVLFNLYTNAIQAMPEGGVLTVSCQVVSTELAHHAKEGEIAFDTPIGRSDQQHWLELAVSDMGIGIAQEQLKRIFQPFFTTKAHGIGLGLPITRRLIEDHCGHLLVRSQPGAGATFCVRLPIVEEGIKEHEFEHSHY